ncbi:hypothetical protein FEM48_Zijuj11G0069100 [Ziziphus jujuba var. spinosa]|uniref:Uncharacterized protein n=1 Tax=Ziziphus jujuba var. spinosa TaxID=714518 RepID=A0A978UHH2_ZIZJJ|nr:hypothetical protein FEM48_Zijuj11G0069100 [Ziziphus jujuba var. spinosa]
MKKLLEFGRKAMFYVRVLSGYEERRIRSFRLQLEKRIQQAQERKAALRKIPEQAILAEVRRMVEEMQTLNRKLDETLDELLSKKCETPADISWIILVSPSEEAAIEEYFKPIDKEAEAIMKMQLEGEEKTMREMMKAMQQQALLEKTESNKTAKVHDIDTDQNQDPSSSTAAHQAQMR